MDRHRTDFGALLFGLVFLATGAGYVVHEVSGRSIDPAWILAVTCSTIGAAFLAATLLHGQWRRDDETPMPEVPAEPAD